jgi:hypothetical protein
MSAIIYFRSEADIKTITSLTLLQTPIIINQNYDHLCSTNYSIMPSMIKFGLFAVSEIALMQLLASVTPSWGCNLAVLASACTLAKFFHTSAHIDAIALKGADFIVNLQEELTYWLADLRSENANNQARAL